MSETTGPFLHTHTCRGEGESAGYYSFDMEMCINNWTTSTTTTIINTTTAATTTTAAATATATAGFPVPELVPKTPSCYCMLLM